MSDTDQPSLAKQLLGAAVGMLIALGVYQSYEVASPHLEAYLFPPGTSIDSPPAPAARIAGKLDPAVVNRVALRAQSLTEHLSPGWMDAHPAPLDPSLVQPVSSSSLSQSVATLSTSSVASSADTESSVAEPMAATFSSVSVEEESSASSSAHTSLHAKVTAMHEGAPKLPSSGISLWLAVALALGASAMCVPGIRARVLGSVER